MKVKEQNIFTGLFLTSLLLEGLDAFSIFKIPISWIGLAVLLTALPLYYFSDMEINTQNFTSIKYWVLYMSSVAILRSISFNLEVPEYATTSYLQYVSLRLLKILSFFVAILIVHLMSTYLTRKKIIQYFAYVGVFISLLSLYSYFSYFLELPDFIRSRAGSGGWSQPIERACSILRNYGTFREPSFLAIWTVPFVPIILYLARKDFKWYFLSIFPIFSLVLTRSLTGVIALLTAFTVISITYLIKNKKIDIKLIIPILAILFTSLVSNNLSYKFPALDPSMCPPNSADKCNCAIYDDELDKAKNSENVAESIFSRTTLIIGGGLDGFGNFSFLTQHITKQDIKYFGDGLGSANIIYSYEFEELSSEVISNQKVFRNPGQIVSFNNLYAYIYFSGGLVGLFWFLYIVFTHIKKAIIGYEVIDSYLGAQLISILLMFFFQAEEPSIILGLAISLSSLEEVKDE